MDNKKLVETLSAKLGRSADDINKLLDGLSGVLRTRCGDLDSVIVPGFGTFEPRKRNERVMVNPKTGKRMLVPPKLVLNFRPNVAWKAKVK